MKVSKDRLLELALQLGVKHAQIYFNKTFIIQTFKEWFLFI